MNRAFRLAVAPLASVLLAACGAGTLPQPNVGAAGFGENTSGTVVVWCRAATAPATELIAQHFNASHTGLKIKVDPIPDAQYITKVATAIRANDVPDLLDLDDINSTLLATHDALSDLTPLIDALPYKKRLSPAHLNLAALNGRNYAVPFAADVSMLFYNKDLFRRAGITAAPTSLAAVLADARKITALGGGVKGLSFGGDSPGIMGFTALPDVWAAHTTLFKGAVGHQVATIAANTPLQQMLAFYRRLWSEKLVPASDRTESGATWGADFKAGTVGMWPGNWGLMVSAKKSFLDHVGVVPLPGPTGGGAVFSGGDNLAIPRGAKNASGAWQFAQFALEPAQQAILPASGYTPVRADVATPSFRAKYRLDAAAVDALPKYGYAEKTLAYNTAVNQASGPFLELFQRAVFSGDVSGAIRSGQTAFTRALQQAQD
jgi:multiple sugar transport system substrate-binding protein